MCLLHRVRSVGLTSAAVIAALAPAARAQTVPVVTLSASTATSADRFGAILNVRELPGGRLLVDDGKNREVKLLSSSLTTERIVLDSALESANTYGNFPLALIPYLADSTLFPSPNKARAVFVIDPNGNVARTLAMPRASDVPLLRRAVSDDKGRIIFAAPAEVKRAPALGVPPLLLDSVPLLRADLATRRTDTIAFVVHPMLGVDTWNGRGQLTFWMPDALKWIDDWAVLSDGSLALVRGHDYHVDWLRSDDSKSASPKLPFEWRQLTDAQKEGMIDSAQHNWQVAAENNTLLQNAERPPTPWPRATLSGSSDPAAPTRPSFDTTKAVVTNAVLSGSIMARLPNKPTVDQVFDYYAPIRDRAAMADLDNQLWVLPTISKESKAGELVYDVVGSKGELVRRVRLPAGRYIIGFGKGGVVYLAHGDLKNGFAVERATVVGAK